MNKRKLIGAVLIVMALIVMLLPATEADAETSASAFKIESGELVKYTGTGTTVSVPDTVEVIGKGAFELNTTVEKIILPDSVKEIKPYAFWGCENLKTVVLGKGLEEIGDFAFMNCSGLETMEIPTTVSRIGIQAFAYCNSFEDITIPTEVMDIDDEAFENDYLLNIHCETGSYADKYAQEFYEKQKNMTVYSTGTSDSDTGDDSADSSDTTSNNTTSNDAGSDSSAGASLEIVGEVLGSTRVVGNQAVVLMQSSGLPVTGDGKNYVNSALNSGVVSAVQTSWQVPERAHYRDTDLKEETLSDDIREIGQFAYARSGLQKIQLPEGLEKIDYAAFYHCDDLAYVEIPESVTEVAAKAFAHTAWVENFMNGSDETEGDFLISGGVLIAYRGSEEDVTLPEEVRVVAEGVFEERSESVDMEAAAQAPTVQSTLVFPYTWIAAAILLLGGVICIFQRAR